jgi:hypothetical protein
MDTPEGPPPPLAFTKVKDSGERQEFDTGSRRDTRAGKGRFDLMSPIVLVRDAAHLQNGADKYGERNWEKGQPLSRYLDSAMRHLTEYLEGMRDEDHLAAARWNIAGMIHTETMVQRGLLPAELADLPTYVEHEGRHGRDHPAEPERHDPRHDTSPCEAE